MQSSVIQMITHCGPVAKVILILLLIESIVAWAIVFRRLSFLRKVAAANKAFRIDPTAANLAHYDSSNDDNELSPLANLASLAANEYKRMLDVHNQTNSRDVAGFFKAQQEMCEHKLDSAILSHSSNLEKSAFFLAVTSSSAPFLGLLGTVWGIMDAFFEIGKQGSASLPVVAPGIAEALISTAIGLFVAIPAVFFFNLIIQKVQTMQDDMIGFKEELLFRIKQETMALAYPSTIAENQTSAREAL
jgi:biopolymer transport protein TolQ